MRLFSKTLTLPKTLAATTLTELPLPRRVILPLTQGIGEPARVCVAVEAIGAGRRAARSIHRYLSGQEISPPDNAIRKDTSLPDVDEVEQGLDEKMACGEADRCLSCGLICYRTSCPAHLSMS